MIHDEDSKTLSADFKAYARDTVDCVFLVPANSGIQLGVVREKKDTANPFEYVTLWTKPEDGALKEPSVAAGITDGKVMLQVCEDNNHDHVYYVSVDEVVAALKQAGHPTTKETLLKKHPELRQLRETHNAS